MNIISEKEEVKKAIRWMSEQLEDHPEKPQQKLLEKAIFEFNLSPSDAEYLIRFFRERKAVH